MHNKLVRFASRLQFICSNTRNLWISAEIMIFGFPSFRVSGSLVFSASKNGKLLPTRRQQPDVEAGRWD